MLAFYQRFGSTLAQCRALSHGVSISGTPLAPRRAFRHNAPMPDSAAIHRWEDLPSDRPMPGIVRQRIIGEKAMLSHVLLEPGTHVPTHAHENEQFAVVLRGRVRFGLGAEGSPDRREVTLTAGDVLQLPSNCPHSADAIDQTLILDVFSPPSAGTGIDRR